ncbi:MAG: hypothetical protein OXE87_00805 [Chloroflexi bacterium]|nr:hypothetical protein [Chloroflexota bacterium]
MTNITMIFRSKWMVAGVICEILAFIAAVGNWFAGSWLVWQLLPNIALTLATLGAVMVAGRVAWDYHGRGLNERQKSEVNDTVYSSGLNATQAEEVAQIAESSGLNSSQQEAVNEILSRSNLNEVQRGAVAQIIENSGLSLKQASELPAKLMDIYLPRIVSAQQAAIVAADYLRPKGHGRVVVLTDAGGGSIEVQCIDPPEDALTCERQHDREEGDADNFLKIAASHLHPFAGNTMIWLPPAGNGIKYTNGAIHPAMHLDGRRWVFSREDCVPKRLDPRDGDYVLARGESGEYTWEQKS